MFDFNITQEEINNIIKNTTGIEDSDNFINIVEKAAQSIDDGELFNFTLPTTEDIEKAAEYGQSAYSQALEMMQDIDITPPNITQDDMDRAQEDSARILEQFSEQFNFHDDT